MANESIYLFHKEYANFVMYSQTSILDDTGKCTTHVICQLLNLHKGERNIVFIIALKLSIPNRDKNIPIVKYFIYLPYLY
jgi:hypothetical protein